MLKSLVSKWCFDNKCKCSFCSFQNYATSPAFRLLLTVHTAGSAAGAAVVGPIMPVSALTYSS